LQYVDPQYQTCDGSDEVGMKRKPVQITIVLCAERERKPGRSVSS
jgi:hypothetical protein